MLNGGLFLYKMYNFKSKFEFYIQNNKKMKFPSNFETFSGSKRSILLKIDILDMVDIFDVLSIT